MFKFLPKLIFSIQKFFSRIKFPYKYLKKTRKSVNSLVYTIESQKISKAIATRKIRPIVIYAAIVIVILAPVIYLVNNRPGESEAAWFDDAWIYRQRLPVTNSGSAQTDFQISFTLDTAALITAGKMQSDCDDLRVVGENGSILPHWVEENNPGCNNSATRVWVKVPSIPTSGINIYVYYGNSSAAFLGDGRNVFPFFDDFNDGLDGIKWSSTTESYSISDGALNLTDGTVYSNNQAVSTAQNYMYEHRVKWTSTTGAYGGLQIADVQVTSGSNANSNALVYLMGNAPAQSNHQILAFAANGAAASYNITSGTTQYTATADTYHISGFSVDGSNVRFYNNRSQTNSYSGTWSQAPYLWLGYFIGATSGTTDIKDLSTDWVLVRKFATTPPTVGSFASEEVSQGPIGYWKFDEGHGVVANSTNTNLPAYLASAGSRLASRESYAAGDLPFATGIGDVNNDGHDDFVVTSLNDNVVSVFINNGNGTFATKVDYATGSVPSAVAVGDVNNDGYVDLVVGNLSSVSMSVFINNGDGTFAAKVDYTTESLPGAVYIGEVNNDGYADIAVVYTGSTTLSVFINNGDGTFATRVNYTTGTNPNSVVIGDVNNDGYSDIAVANRNSNTVSIFLNNGSGTFAAKVDYATGNGAISVKMGDLNGDGYLDLAVANNSGGSLSVLMNNGNGTFATKVDYTAGSAPVPVVIADLNGNGLLDLAVGNRNSDTISVFMNNGNGTFAAKVDYVSPGDPASLSAGDFDGDGKVDLVASSVDDDVAYVFMNNGNGTFQTSYAAGSSVFSVAMEDVNGDGYADFVTANLNSNTISVFMNNRNGTFATKVDYGAGTQPYSVTTGDVNNDGYVDIAVTNFASTSVSVFINNGNGTFATKVDYTTGTSPSSVEIADVNNDGYADLSISNFGSATVSVLMNNGDGTFATKVDYTTGTQPITVSTRDVNNDGYADIAVASTTAVSVLINNGNGTFASKVDYTAGTTPYSIIIEDVNGDGYRDLAVTNSGSATVSILMNNGNGTFATKVDYTAGTTPVTLAAGDINGDGFADLAVGNLSSNNLSILINNGNGTFASKVDYTTEAQPRGLSISDVNGDGKVDIAVSHVSGSSVLIFTNTRSTASWQQEGDCPDGKCLHFDGVDDYVSMGNLLTAKFGTGDFSYGAWVKVTENPGINTAIIQKRTNVDLGYELHVTENMTLRGSAAGNFGGESNTVLEENVWTHVFVTRSGTVTSLYVNGAFDRSKTDNSVDASSNNPLVIGHDFINKRYLPAFIDEVKIYPYARSPEEIKADYAKGSGPKGAQAVMGRQSANDFPDGQVAHYKMDEGEGTVIVDTSGNGSHGGFGGYAASPQWASGKYGSGLKFDGTDDFALVPSPASGVLDFGTEDFSYSFWMKTSTTHVSAGQMVYKRSTTSGNPGYSVAVLSTNKVQTVLDDGLVAEVNSESTTSVNTDTWYHVAVTHDRSSTQMMYLYINGVLEDSDNISGVTGSITNPNSLFFGRNGVSSIQFYNGQLDDVKFYNYVLSQKQITSDMNAGHANVGSPVGSALAHYKFDEGYGSTANNSGNAGSTINGALGASTAAPAWTSDGKFGKALSFDGTNDYVSAANFPYVQLGSGYGSTYSFWVKTSSSLQRYIFAKNTDFNAASSYEFGLNLQANGTLRWIGGTGGVLSTRTINDGNWRHVAVVADGTNLHYYIDGVHDSTHTISTNTEKAVSLLIGARRTTNSSTIADYFPGLIDDFKIYNYALTPDEVKVDYNQGKSSTLGSTGTTSAGIADGSSAREYCVPGDTSTCSAPIAEWKFDENTGTSAFDSSDNNRTGTLTNSPIWTNGIKGNALDYSGTAHVNLGSSAFTGSFSEFSASAWIVNNASALSFVLDFGADLNNRRFAIMNGGSVGNLQGAVQGICSVNAQYTGMEQNQWYHVTFTFKQNDACKLYVNGQLASTQTANNNAINLSSATGQRIGGRINGGNTWVGKIDDMRVYNYTRTPAQIAWEYSKGAPVAHYKMDECEGTTVYNSVPTFNGAPAGNNGTLSIGGSGTNTAVGTCATSGARANGASGKYSSSVDFDGVDDRFTFTTTGVLHTSSGTVSLWVNLDGSQPNPAFAFSQPAAGSSSRIYVAWGGGGTTMSTTLGSTTIGTYNMTPGEWYHVVLTWNGTASRMYINGVDNTSSGTFGGMTSFVTPTIVGCQNNSPSQCFDGRIDDVKIWNYSLTSTQVKNEYNSGAVRFD